MRRRLSHPFESHRIGTGEQLSIHGGEPAWLVYKLQHISIFFSCLALFYKEMKKHMWTTMDYYGLYI